MHAKDWSNSTAVCRAFNIGKWEGAAVSALQSSIEKPVVAMLKDFVAKRGMKGFLSHEVLGRGIFSTGWTSGSGPTESWNVVMTNTDDGALAAQPCCDKHGFSKLYFLGQGQASVNFAVAQIYSRGEAAPGAVLS